MDLESTYFFTATILNWQSLLKKDALKEIVTDSLAHLVSNRKVTVYGFVVMPNHIHLIWRNLEMNGREYPNESLLKFTSHSFKKVLRSTGSLNKYSVNKSDREYQFWQRSPLPIPILSREMLEQKLDYIHLNPLQTHWDLVDDPNDYLYSSCAFYKRNGGKFPWLTDYREDF